MLFYKKAQKNRGFGTAVEVLTNVKRRSFFVGGQTAYFSSADGKKSAVRRRHWMSSFFLTFFFAGGYPTLQNLLQKMCHLFV